MDYAIGIDLGGTRIKAAAVTSDGRIIEKIMRRTDEQAPDWAAQVRDYVLELQLQCGGEARWMGVGAPGIAAPDGRCIAWMQGRLEVLQGLDWGELFGRPGRVPVINDAQAAMMGEVWQGAAKGCDNVVMLTLGTGVGGAILCDGRLLRGAYGRAGHLGHISLDPDGPLDIVNTPGALEYHIGNYSIAERSGGKFASTYELIEAYKAGDREAERIWLSSVKALAAALASIINAVDPRIIVLGGGIAQAGDALFTPLREHLDQFEWRPHGHSVQLVTAVGGEFTGALGAAYHAIRSAGEA